MALIKTRANPIKHKLYLDQIQKDLDRIHNENDTQSATPISASPTSSTYSSGTSASISAFTEIASAANSNASSSILNKNSAASFLSRQQLRKSTGSVVVSSPSDNEMTSGNKAKPARKSELALAFERRNLRPVHTEGAREETHRTSESRNDASHVQLPKTNLSEKRYQRTTSTSSLRSPMVVDVDSSGCDFDDNKLQELFVEMCFFARLGYVQPPCCLRCTYREALKDGNVQSQCQRWVIWRKSADQLLHPTQLEGNMMLVQCRAARRLLAGNTIDGYTWSAERQELCSGMS